MLRQEINLYNAFETKLPAANFLTWKKLWHCFIFITAVFFAMYLFSLIHLYYLNANYASLQKRVDSLKFEFYALKKNYPEVFFSQDVSLSIESLQKELTEQKKLLQSLTLPVPFSHGLIGLSVTIVPDVWLTEIDFANHGQMITLKGKSNSMDRLQIYIAQLMKYPLFKSYAFNLDNTLKINNAKDGGNLQFELNMQKPNS